MAWGAAAAPAAKARRAAQGLRRRGPLPGVAIIRRGQRAAQDLQRRRPQPGVAIRRGQAAIPALSRQTADGRALAVHAHPAAAESAVMAQRACGRHGKSRHGRLERVAASGRWGCAFAARGPEPAAAADPVSLQRVPERHDRALGARAWPGVHLARLGRVPRRQGRPLRGVLPHHLDLRLCCHGPRRERPAHWRLRRPNAVQRRRHHAAIRRGRLRLQPLTGRLQRPHQ
mmetsp:Transcript_108599/g.350585  ORF Transcript_108599/g.350585 Transcript_108599/m.350585 type:complete len:229 (-) Transcript_108599:1371-2057(-)